MTLSDRSTDGRLYHLSYWISLHLLILLTMIAWRSSSKTTSLLLASRCPGSNRWTHQETNCTCSICFDIVERTKFRSTLFPKKRQRCRSNIRLCRKNRIRLVAFDNVASILLLLWTWVKTTPGAALRAARCRMSLCGSVALPLCCGAESDVNAAWGVSVLGELLERCWEYL